MALLTLLTSILATQASRHRTESAESIFVNKLFISKANTLVINNSGRQKVLAFEELVRVGFFA